MKLTDIKYKSLLPHVSNDRLLAEYIAITNKKSILSRYQRDTVSMEFMRRVFIGEIVIKVKPEEPKDEQRV